MNVKNDSLSTFISTAESLQIKGLTDNDGSKATPEIIPTQILTVQSPTQQTLPPPQSTRTQRAQRGAPRSVESEDSSTEERVIATTVKRSAGTVSLAKGPTKRVKLSAAAAASIRKAEMTTIKAEEDIMIELPMSLNSTTTAEDVVAVDTEQHIEETVETEEQTESLIEEDTYGDIKYDESYFTENEDQKQITSYTSADQSGADVSATDNQGELNDAYAMGIQFKRDL